MEFCLCDIILFLTIIRNCNPAKILVLSPTPSYSHQQPLLALSRELALRGHNLTLVTTNPSKEPIPNQREIDISFTYSYMHEHMKKHMRGFSLQERHSPFGFMSKLSNWIEFIPDVCLGSEPVRNLMREVNGTTFDLIIYQSFGYTSLLGFADLVGNPPVIGVNTMHAIIPVDIEIGNPINPSYIPCVQTPLQHRMTLWERAFNLFATLYLQYRTEAIIKPMQERLLKKHFGTTKHTAEELDRNKSLTIFSADLASSYARPIQPNVVYVGSLHMKDASTLTDEVKKWMDESEDGVIYFSLGSNMKSTSVDPERRAVFIKAFAMLPRIRVLWKWESDEKLPGQTENVLVNKWLPQQAILAHPKTKVFISQMGLQSFQEAIHYTIPILGVPMYGDQLFNSAKLVESGGGITIDFSSIEPEELVKNLQLLLTDPSFKENMKRQSAITNDKVMPALDLAVWWVEYVIRHNGATHLRPAVLDLRWYEYLLLDIIGALILFLVLLSYIIYFSVNKIIFSNTKFKVN